MAIIKELPKLDRPREKAIHYGLTSLSDIELLTLLIGNGYRGISALELASTLLTRFKGLSNLSQSTLKELTKVKGIKNAKALNLLAIFELHKRLARKEMEKVDDVATSEYLYNKYKEQFISSHQENLVLVILNNRKRIIHEKTLYIGTENNVVFSYKDVWREVLNYQGRCFYLIHNHPNGLAVPSQKDIAFTSELIRESNRIDIPMVDHLIIGKDGYYSFLHTKK